MACKLLSSIMLDLSAITPESRLSPIFASEPGKTKTGKTAKSKSKSLTLTRGACALLYKHSDLAIKVGSGSKPNQKPCRRDSSPPPPSIAGVPHST